MKFCEVCGKQFEPHQYNQVCCSTECREERHRQTDYARYLRARHPVKKVCQVCGKDFEALDVKRETCSRKCLTVLRHNLPPITCANCGKNFQPSSPAQRFCSKSCATSYSKKKRQAKNGKTLEEWAIEARQCGMSYGKYRCQVERFGKTFEELKLRR